MIEASAWNGSTESFDKLRVTVFGEVRPLWSDL